MSLSIENNRMQLLNSSRFPDRKQKAKKITHHDGQLNFPEYRIPLY